MACFIRSASQRTVIYAALVGCLLAGASFVGYQQHTKHREHIIPFDQQRDLHAVVTLFNANKYWLTADEEYNPENTFITLSPSFNPAYQGKLQVRVLRQADNLLGFVAYYMKSFYEGFILFLVVDNKYRGKGYGEKLLRDACNDLIAHNVGVIRLITRPSNSWAQALYKRNQFIETARDNTYVYLERRIK